MSVSSRRQTPTWPFLMVLCSLFVLSLTAPRKWERIARSQPLMSSAKFARKSKPVVEVTVPTRVEPPLVRSPAIAPVDAAPLVPPSVPPPPVLAASPAPLPAPPAVRLAPVVAAAPAPVPARRKPDLGSAIAKLAPEPPLLGANGQLTLRVPADLSPVVVMRPQRPSGPMIVDPAADIEDAAEATFGSSSAAPEASGLIEPPVAREIVADDSLDAPATPAFAWAAPTELLDRLELLTGRDGSHVWAYEAIALIHELLSTAGPHSPEAVEILGRLEATAASSGRVAAELSSSDSAELQRTAYALRRRLAVWSPLAELPQRDDAELAIGLPEPDRLSLCLTEVDAVTQGDAAGRGWRDYLLLDSLHGLAAGRGGSDASSTRLLAQRVLERLTAARLSKSQRQFVADETLSQLAAELRCWAAEPVAAEELLSHVEAYESSSSGDDARRLAADLHRLAWSPVVELQDYGRQLEQSYRNANVRVVISETLLSRMMPPQPPLDETVRETILGAPTRGRSRTETDITAQLIPDPRRLRFLVEAHGRVTARTNSQSGPATMSSVSNSTFEATREMEMTLMGLQAREMKVSANSTARLRNVATNLDAIPVLGSLVNGYARQQYTEKRSSAERELERIVAQKAIDNIAAQSSARVAETNRRLQEHLLAPLDRLQIEPTVIETQTSDDRMTVRLRIAGDEQLGAHTPRPRAPGDSLLSAQLHESAVNNFLNRLDLGGRLVSERKMWESLTSLFALPAAMLPADLHDNVLIQLAEEDPIRVKFQDGRIAIELRVDELQAEGQAWRNFVVRAFYAPDPDSEYGELMRDGTVQLIGTGLRAKGQIALRGMFSKTFSKDRRIAIVPEQLRNDPRMATVRVTQWAVADGWVGIALGDVRPSQSNIAKGASTQQAAK